MYKVVQTSVQDRIPPKLGLAGKSCRLAAFGNKSWVQAAASDFWSAQASSPSRLLQMPHSRSDEFSRRTEEGEQDWT